MFAILVRLMFGLILVLAGGSSADVAFYDLRMMTEGASQARRVVQRYRPTGLAAAENVSVSGLDLSRDKQELLVSYESDQIYTFPVFPHLKSAAGPTLDELEDLNGPRTRDECSGPTKVLSQLAAYGGHLNRFTFLKVRSIKNGGLKGLNCKSEAASPKELYCGFTRMQSMPAPTTSTFAPGLTRDTHGFMKKLLGAWFLF